MRDRLLWTCDDISSVDSQSNERDRAKLLLHAQYGKNPSASSLIKHTQLSGNDLYPSILYDPLIEDEEPNISAMPKFAYKLGGLRRKISFLDVLSYQIT